MQRWPSAEVHGIDLSAEMVSQAQQYASDRVSITRGDIRDWRSSRPVDVLVSNATLQWVPQHRMLLPDWVASLSPAGWLALQVPGNFDEPSHRLLHLLAGDRRFAEFTAAAAAPQASDAATYLEDLAGLGCSVEAWETTYLHVLTGPDPVFDWISGTGARPMLQALPDTLRAVFEQEYRELLRHAYPERPFGTVLPYRRVFVVAQRS